MASMNPRVFSNSGSVRGIVWGRVLDIDSPREMRKRLVLRLYLGVLLRSVIIFFPSFQAFRVLVKMFQNQMHVNNIYKLHDYEAEADLYVGFSKHGFSVWP